MDIFDVKLQFLMDATREGWLRGRSGLWKSWSKPADASELVFLPLLFSFLQYCAFPPPSLQAKTQEEPGQQHCVGHQPCVLFPGAWRVLHPSAAFLRFPSSALPLALNLSLDNHPSRPLFPTATWLSVAFSSPPPQCAPSWPRWRTRVCPKSCSCRASQALTTRVMPLRRLTSG